MATALRQFEPPVKFVNTDGTLTDRALGYLRSLFKFTGASDGLIPVDSLGGDGVTQANYLSETGAWSVPAPRANPTASIGLTVVNGTATTYMRSDAAPPLDQAITPTWTGAHIFSAPVTFQVASGTTLTWSVGTALTVGTTATVTGGFGCNGKTAQTSASANAAISATAGAAYGATEQGMLNDTKALLNQIRAALIADGIMV